MEDRVRFGSDGFVRFLVSVTTLALLVALGGLLVLVLRAGWGDVEAVLTFGAGDGPGVVLLEAAGDPGPAPFTASVAVDYGFDRSTFPPAPLGAAAALSAHRLGSEADLAAGGPFGFRLRLAGPDAPSVAEIGVLSTTDLGPGFEITGLIDADGDGRDDDHRFTLSAPDGSAACVDLGPPATVDAGAGAGGLAAGGYSWDPYGPCGERSPPRVGAESRTGSTPGVYGGSASGEVCDAGALAEALDGDSLVSEAWAAVHEVPLEGLAAFVEAQTAVVLLHDTAAMDHQFQGGRVTSHLAVLQKGTVVLVDDRGGLTGRCASGSPLRGVGFFPDDVVVDGPGWRGFALDGVVSVRPGERPVERFDLVDVRTGRLMPRVPGVAGTVGILAGPLPRGETG